MSDYKVTDTQLTSIANAIRAKTGKSAQIEFPTEFVSEIGSINGGSIDTSKLSYKFRSSDSMIIGGRYFKDYNNSRQLDLYGSDKLKQHNDWSKPWKIKTTYIPSGTASDYQFLIGGTNDFWYIPSIQIDADNAGAFVEASSDGTSSNSVQVYILQSDGLNIQNNVPVILIGEYDGNKLKLTINDGTNVISKEANISGVAAGTSRDVSINGTRWYSGRACNGTFDLFNTYIKSEGNIIWGCDSGE